MLINNHHLISSVLNTETGKWEVVLHTEKGKVIRVIDVFNDKGEAIQLALDLNLNSLYDDIYQ